MFGIGFSEILIIAFVALLFIKPEDMPKVLRTLGRLFGRVKALYDEAVSVKDKVIQEINEASSLELPDSDSEKKENAKDSASEKSASPDARSSEHDAG